MSIKRDAQDAADAAVLAAATQKFKDIEAGQRNSLSFYDTMATDLFVENLRDSSNLEVASASLIEDGNDFVFTSQQSIQSLFPGFTDLPYLSSTVSSRAGLSDRTGYADIHFVIDRSESMLIPEGLSEIDRMRDMFVMDLNSGGGDNCAFACHTGSPSYFRDRDTGLTGVELARANNIYMRMDRIKDELQRVFGLFDSDPKYANVQVALQAFNWEFHDLMPLGSDMTLASETVAAIEAQGHSRVAEMMRKVGAELPDKSVASLRSGVVVLITDGADYIEEDLGADPYGFDSSSCSLARSKGYEVVVLQLEYPDVTRIRGEHSDREDRVAAVLPQIESELTNCASPGMYFKADWADSVTDAIDDIIGEAISGKSQVVFLKQ